jgi:hypothetical protein
VLRVFLRRVHIFCADRAWPIDMEEIWVCRPKEEVDGVEQEKEYIDLAEGESSSQKDN